MLNRNRLPSTVATKRCVDRSPVKPVLKSSRGAVKSKFGDGAIDADIIEPSGAMKNSSRPSPRHCGCSPPDADIGHCSPVGGTGDTYTCIWPDDCAEAKASHLPSGEIRAVEGESQLPPTSMGLPPSVGTS